MDEAEPLSENTHTNTAKTDASVSVLLQHGARGEESVQTQTLLFRWGRKKFWMSVGEPSKWQTLAFRVGWC